MEQMGMTDKQFNRFIRFLIDDLKEAKEEEDTEKKKRKDPEDTGKPPEHSGRLKKSRITTAQTHKRGRNLPPLSSKLIIARLALKKQMEE